MANLFRMYLHAAAMNLLVQLRQEIVNPPIQEPSEIPVEALVRKVAEKVPERVAVGIRWAKANHALAFAVIKVAATVVVSTRRILIQLSRSWPNRNFFEHVSQHVLKRPAALRSLGGMNQ